VKNTAQQLKGKIAFNPEESWLTLSGTIDTPQGKLNITGSQKNTYAMVKNNTLHKWGLLCLE